MENLDHYKPRALSNADISRGLGLSPQQVGRDLTGKVKLSNSQRIRYLKFFGNTLPQASTILIRDSFWESFNNVLCETGHWHEDEYLMQELSAIGQRLDEMVAKISNDKHLSGT